MRSSSLDLLSISIFTLVVWINAAPSSESRLLPRETPGSNKISRLMKLELYSSPATQDLKTRNDSTDLTVSSKPSISSKNITSIRNITYENWYSFAPSAATANSLLGFYADIRAYAIDAVAALQARYLRLESGALQLILSCSSQPISREVVTDIIKYMETRVRSGLLGLGKFVVWVGQMSAMYVVINAILRAVLLGEGLPLHNIVVLNGRNDEGVN